MKKSRTGPSKSLRPVRIRMTRRAYSATSHGVCVIITIATPERVQLAHQRHHLALLAIVQPGRRLIEDQQARAQREHARDREPLTLPFAEQKRIAGAFIFEAHRRQHLGASRFDLRGREAEIARPEFHFGLDRVGENLMVGILEDVADFARGLGRPQAWFDRGLRAAPFPNRAPAAPPTSSPAWSCPSRSGRQSR